MTFLPISINIDSQKILLIGGGKVASHKAAILHRFTDKAIIIAPDIHPDIEKLPFIIIRKAYEKSDLTGFNLVYVCTNNHELNKQIKRDAEELGILTSVCDNPALCDFVSPAVFKSGNITISIGSDAKNVKRSIVIRDRIKKLIEDGILQID